VIRHHISLAVSPTSSSTVFTPDKLDDENGPEESNRNHHFPEKTIYSAEALRAVGLGLSPTMVRDIGLSRGGDTISSNIIPFSNQSKQASMELQHPGNAHNDDSKSLQLSFRLIRAWDLPDCLGGTNPYVLLQVNGYKGYTTKTVYNDTSPNFGDVITLSLSKSPTEEFDNLLQNTVLTISAFHKNLSLSDEFLASAEVCAASLQEAPDPLVVHLLDRSGLSAGCVELAMVID
jgi:hypothetical protein